MAMTLEDEIKFYMDAKASAKANSNDKDFEKRLNVLFAQGQLSENAYLILRQIFGYTAVITKTKVVESYSNGRC